MATEGNGYLDYQWYDHIDIMKGAQLYDVVSQDEYVML
jgi:hypothetical protein